MTDPNQPPQNTPPAYEAPAYSAPAYPSAPQYSGGGTAPDAPVPGKTMGIVAFVLSFFIQIIGLILGIVALVQSRKAGHKNGFALAAIIISSVLLVVGVIAAIVFFTFVVNASTDLYDQYLVNCGPGGSGYIETLGEQIPCEQVDQSQLD